MTHTSIYTEQEQLVINEIQRILKCGIDQIFIGDLEIAGFDTKKVRGTIASLVKKGRIDVNKQDGGLITLFSAD